MFEQKQDHNFAPHGQPRVEADELRLLGGWEPGYGHGSMACREQACRERGEKSRVQVLWALVVAYHRVHGRGSKRRAHQDSGLAREDKRFDFVTAKRHKP